jgi:hypothetical protein
VSKCHRVYGLYRGYLRGVEMHLDKKSEKLDWGMAQVVKHLPNKFKPQYQKKKR